MVKANVDKILDELKQNNSTTLSVLSKKIGLKKEDVEKSIEYLEQDGTVKIEHKFPHTVVTLLTKPEVQDLPQPPKLDVSQENLSIQPNQMQGNSMNMPTPPQIPPLSTTNQGMGQNLPPPMGQQSGQVVNTNPTIQTQRPGSMSSSPMPGMPTQNISTEPISTIPSEPIPVPNLPESKPFELTSTSNNLFAPAKPLDNIPSETQSIPNVDPLNPDAPKFDLAAPTPSQKDIRPVLDYTENFSSTTSDLSIQYPVGMKEDTEKIEFLMDRINRDINNHKYEGINDVYRKLHDVFSNSEKLSPNERFILSEKINEMFERIKNLYVIEQVS